ncbi:MAG TPA: family 78 glycoside hydrolase catalytic domain [Prolixibacteraceae bacterium]|nr:family 78 glycoside hydrolase catalytic domain [Prolixibacteraceae bacterium]
MNSYRNDNGLNGQHTPVRGETYAVSASWRIADGLKATKKFNISPLCKGVRGRLLALLISLVLTLNLAAQTPQPTDKWGKNSFISEASSTLNGTKPLANWIWDSGAENPQNYYLLVRKSFTLKSKPTQAKAYISAFASADVYINGKLLERCPMNCDPEFQCYDYFDITPYLQKGENCISAVVCNFGLGMHHQINARGGFFFQGKLDFADKTSTNMLSDNTWKVTQAKAWNSQSKLRNPKAHLIGFIEEFDARLMPEGWKSVGFNDSAWENAKASGIPPVAPFNRLVVTERPLLTRKMVKPYRKWKVNNRIVYDFGTEIAGYPQFTIDAKEGIQFEIGTSERLDTNKVALIRADTDHSEKYTTKKGIQTWRPYTWSGFRYFSIEANADVQIQDVCAEFAHFTYEEESTFECSDKQLTDFWQIGKHTMLLNSMDTYVDPWREHTQYIAGDSRFMMVFGNYCFGKSSRFLTAYNMLCGAESQRWRNDGAIRARYPTDHYMEPGRSGYIPDYQLEWILMMHEYFMYYGNDELIQSLYPNLKKLLEYFRPFVDTQLGLLANMPGWIVLDHPDTYPMDQKKVITGLNCLYYGALNAAASIASDFAKDPNQAKIWKEQAGQLKGNINKWLWSEKDRAYFDSYESTHIGQQSQAYALLYGVPESNQKADVIQQILKRGKGSEQSFAYWVLYSVMTEGNTQWALDYMRKYWGEQTKLDFFNGAWHEAWNTKWGSTSHAWCSGPTALLSQKVLGIEPLDYGWKIFRVKPQTGDLLWARGTVSTVTGNISAAWEKSAGRHFSLNLNVPQGAAAGVYLPTSDLNSVKINGKKLNQESEIKPRLEEDKWVVLTVNAGTYQFECETQE